jgi:hypothetical protein
LPGQARQRHSREAAHPRAQLGRHHALTVIARGARRLTGKSMICLSSPIFKNISASRPTQITHIYPPSRLVRSGREQGRNFDGGGLFQASLVRRVQGGSFLSRYALVGQKALVSRVVHHGTAFLAAHAVGGSFCHGDFVFGTASAFMRSGQPLHEFGHERKSLQLTVGGNTRIVPRRSQEFCKVVVSEQRRAME